MTQSIKHEIRSAYTQNHATAKTVGRRLRDARKRLGLSQETLAPLLKIDQSALSRIESGKQRMTLAHYLTLQTLEIRLAKQTPRQ